MVIKNLPANVGKARDSDSIPGLGRSSREGNGNPLQYSCLENPKGAWWATVHGVTKSRTRLSDFTLLYRVFRGKDEVLRYLDLKKKKKKL